MYYSTMVGSRGQFVQGELLNRSTSTRLSLSVIPVPPVYACAILLSANIGIFVFELLVETVFWDFPCHEVVADSEEALLQVVIVSP